LVTVELQGRKWNISIESEAIMRVETILRREE
jgi:hypothetical protein